jgi:hypothetical protein
MNAKADMFDIYTSYHSVALWWQMTEKTRDIASFCLFNESNNNSVFFACGAVGFMSQLIG